MANQYKIEVDKVWTNYGLAKFDFDNAQIDLNAAWVFWNIPNDHAAIQRTMWSVQHILDGLFTAICGSDPPWFTPPVYYALKYAWQYEIEDLPVVTWQSIAEAWVKDDFEGRVWTIGIIDRMRQIMWDEPFNLTWAARPENEPVE